MTDWYEDTGNTIGDQLQAEFVDACTADHLSEADRQKALGLHKWAQTEIVRLQVAAAAGNMSPADFQTRLAETAHKARVELLETTMTPALRRIIEGARMTVADYLKARDAVERR